MLPGTNGQYEPRKILDFTQYVKDQIISLSFMTSNVVCVDKTSIALR